MPAKRRSTTSRRRSDGAAREIPNFFDRLEWRCAGPYRSTDAGKPWSHLGLEDTRNIGRVRVHPEDPDTAYVAALGHAHGANRERGVFRTRDGGKTWKKVLYRNEKAGAVDLSMDPT